MPDLSLLSKEDLRALASRNFDAMSEEGKRIAFADVSQPQKPVSPAAIGEQKSMSEEISAARKFAYGFEKAKSDIGLLYRTLQVKAGLGKIQFGDNGLEYIPQEQAYGTQFTNSSDEVKAAALERLDQIELQKKYPVLSRTGDAGGWGAAGSFVGSLFSPTTLIPIGAAGKIGYKGLALVGGAFGAEYNILNQLASTAKIDPAQAAVATGISAIATPATAKTFSLLGQGVGKALASRSSSKVQTASNKKMLEIQAVINESVASMADDAAPPTFEELLPEIQKKTGMSLDDIKAAHIESDFNVTIPQNKQEALRYSAAESQSANPFTSANIVTKAARDFIGVVSTDISRINPIIGGRLKKHDAAVGVYTSNYLKKAEPFIKLMNKLPEKILNQANRHLVSEDFDGAKLLLSKYDSNASTIIDDVHSLLQEIDSGLRDAGFVFGKIENYFPRKIINYKDFLNSVGIEYQQPIKKALSDRAKSLGISDVNALPIEEAEEVISMALRSPVFGKLGQKSLAKESRKVVVDDNLITQYKKPQDAIVEHISDSIARIEKRNFFGEAATNKGIKQIDLDDSVDKLIAREIAEGRMATEDFGKLKELLEARFGMGERQTGKGANLAKNLIYQMTIANFMSALTQAADVGMSVFAYGLMPTLKALLGRKKIKISDLNLEQIISAEMGTVGKMAKLLDATFKASGFKLIDKLGKETIVNAAYDKFQKMARSDKGVAALKKRFGNLFADEFDLVVSDLRSKTISDNVKMMMFSELSNFQPISLSEMPLKYLQANNGRVFYALKSFTIKQLDVMRREILHEIADGNPVQGMKKFLAYATILPLSGASVQEVKDFISRGDKIDINDIPDQMVKNIFKTLGTSQYVVENYLKEGKISAAIGEAVLPPISLLDAFGEDLNKLSKGELTAKESKAMQRIPVFGRLVQDILLGAREEKRIQDILSR